MPGCNINCPNTWIRDGYCDKACNNTECDFDGGDCDLKNINRNSFDNARIGLINQSQIIFPDFYCSPGCSTTWLADKYCDNSCNNYNCSFDMGDCGVQNIYDKIYGVNYNNQTVHIPPQCYKRKL